MQITQQNPPAGFIDLGIGQPDPALLPGEIMDNALRARLGKSETSALEYGAEMGHGLLRESLAHFLTAQYTSGRGLDPKELMITAGSTGALDLIANTFTRPGETVFVEEPTYFLAHAIFRDRGLKVVGIPTDRHGMQIQALEEQLTHTKPVLLYTVPSFNNPRGTTLPLDRRRKMIHLSRQHDFLIVADEVYQLLVYGDKPPPPMPLLENRGHVLGIGSFSKILAPGLRLGWIQGDPKMLQRIAKSGVLQSGGGINPFCADLVQRVIAAGEQRRYLERLKVRYDQRARHLSDLLATHLGGRVTFQPPQGGYFIWVRLTPSRDAAALKEKAQEVGVGYKAGIDFSAHKGQTDCLRLCFAYYGRRQLDEGIRRLAGVLAP